MKPNKTEREKQATHFRVLQWAGFVATCFAYVATLSAVGAIILILPDQKYNLIRELVGGAVTLATKSFYDYITFIINSGASSARRIERAVESEQQKNPE